MHVKRRNGNNALALLQSEGRQVRWAKETRTRGVGEEMMQLWYDITQQVHPHTPTSPKPATNRSDRPTPRLNRTKPTDAGLQA